MQVFEMHNDASTVQRQLNHPLMQTPFIVQGLREVGGPFSVDVHLEVIVYCDPTHVIPIVMEAHLPGWGRWQEATGVRTYPCGHHHTRNAELVHRNGLIDLTELVLYDVKVTDAGLEHVKGLTNRQLLDLCGTQITDARVAELKKALPDCHIAK